MHDQDNTTERGSRLLDKALDLVEQGCSVERTAGPSFVSFCFLLQKCLGFKPFGPRVSNMPLAIYKNILRTYERA